LKKKLLVLKLVLHSLFLISFAGLSDFEDNDSILARVLAASQEEYLNSLKKQKTVSAHASPAPSHPASPQSQSPELGSQGQDAEGQSQSQEGQNEDEDQEEGACGYRFGS
jgi:hypothetical protein